MELIRKIESTLEVAGEIPMWGFAPKIEDHAITELIQKTLELPEVSVGFSKSDWKEKDELLDGMGEKPLLLGIHLSPLSAPLLLVVPQTDSHLLSKWVLGKDLNDPSFQEGFFQFALTKLISVSDNVVPGLTPKLCQAKMPEHAAYTTDISLSNQSETLWARLICSTPFHAEYKLHYASHPPKSVMQRSHLPLSMRVEVGSVDLKLSVWGNVRSGDFIILDACSYSPTAHSGTALIYLKETPLFQAKIKGGQLKLLEYADILEERPMAENIDDENDNVYEEAPHSHTAELLSAKEIPLSIHV